MKAPRLVIAAIVAAGAIVAARAPPSAEVESISSQAPLADDLRFMTQTWQSRVSEGEVEYPDLALNSLVLVLSP